MPDPKSKNSFSEAGEDEEIIDNAHVIEADNFQSPLEGGVSNKEYSKPNVKVNQDQLNQEIPEPSVGPELIDLTKKPEPIPQPDQASQQARPQQPFNPQMREMSAKDKRTAAERAVDSILDGYAMLKMLSNKLIQISEKKLKRLHQQRKINMNVPVPIDEYGNVITIEQYVQEFNRQNADQLIFEQEDREAIRPVMVELFTQNGIGFSVRDEFIYLGAKELLFTGIKLFEGLQIKKDMLKVLQELTAEYKKANGQQPVAPPANTPPPPPPPAAQEPTVEIIPPDDGGDQVEYIEPKPPVSLHMQGAEAALIMTGAIQKEQQEQPSKRKGRPTKAEQQKRREELIKNQ